jgi:hypothetical protein
MSGIVHEPISDVLASLPDVDRIVCDALCEWLAGKK